MTQSPIGITGFGAYIPRLRLSRKAMAEALNWLDPNLAANAKGERAVANWDEDSLTMAVEAARDLLAARPTAPERLVFASTTLPFQDRSNAGLLADALGLDETTRPADATGSLRAATTALLSAFDQTGSSLIVAADRRLARPGSVQDFTYGHGAAAISVGSGAAVIAEFLAGHAIFRDLVDHYRAEGETADYVLEERWGRDEGYLKIVPAAVKGALARAGLEPTQVDHFILPGTIAKIQATLAAKLGLRADSVVDPLGASVGDTGAAHPLLMLANLLGRTQPGRVILLVGFGQGADAILLRTTPALADFAPATGVAGWLARRQVENNYLKHLSFSGMVDIHFGMRAEHDKRTAHSVAFRKRDMINGLTGGRCGACDCVQFPRTRVCVNPACAAVDTQKPVRLADEPASVKTFTEDWLGFTPCPPLAYGNVQFANGANVMMEFTDIQAGQLSVGLPVRLVFRLKDDDEKRGFRRYFWKATPAVAAKT
ncbi:3-oxoacyl-[acyl-carrier-protein] synthase III C-terminal domain-containing protein [Niveispirillum sp. KHB5.9]|uniref:3-oxoacyl-[acyl-carrier-protein] synthase III C-terminal domain-containing protein n=1 Tax=Niveispirillum sp. KHB5.9 TaxID=3400269 RepID=UPI003A8AA6F7